LFFCVITEQFAATSIDAKNYAKFLGEMAEKLKPVRILPTVATWNTIWNLTEINEQPLFKIVTMQT
jgi:hypothetical protein